MAQLQCMDARIDTLSDELCQVNTRVGHIARWQAHLGGFAASPSPSPKASTDEDGDDGADDDGKDKDASSSSDKEMTTSQWLPFDIRDKKGEYFWDNESSLICKGRVSIGHFLLGEVSIFWGM